jgi:4-hydroxy-L-threonine phosphate dehydrogenase PdxA
MAIGSNRRILSINNPESGEYTPDCINLIDLPLGYDYEPGVLKAENGLISIEYMKKSYDMLIAEEISAVACAPNNKEAMRLSGSPFIGATELYAHFAGDLKTFTVVEQAGCYIFQMTTHTSLKNAIASIDEKKVYDTLLNAYHTLRQWGIDKPRLAISGLNPHSGDGGALGTEEIEIIIPSIEKASREIGHVDGPVPADAIFIKGYDGVYDGVILLFHDTANVAIKLMEKIHPSVVITGGLPFIRTTVAHGTAYDIAYKGIAGHQQMKNAILAAARISARLNK